MPILPTVLKDDPIYKSGLTITMLSGDSVRSIAKVKKEANESLVDIYRKNKFLLHDNGQEVWFGLENTIDKKYFEKPFAIITAWNPMNKQLLAEENSMLNKQLEDELKVLKYDYEFTIGGLDNHVEESFVIYDIDREKALLLGKKYKQYSIFYNDTKKLEYIECANAKILVSEHI